MVTNAETTWVEKSAVGVVGDLTFTRTPTKWDHGAQGNQRVNKHEQIGILIQRKG